MFGTIPRNRRAPSALVSIAVATAVAFPLAVLATGGFIAASRDSASDAPVGQHQAHPDRPGGTIAYLSGEGYLVATAAGEPLGSTTRAHVAHALYDPLAVETVPSPDGASEVRIDQNEQGVFLALDRGADTIPIAQVAGPSDPSLVSGGKGAARAVEGIPLVVAWAPDGSLLAYGSITGEPYTLSTWDPQAPTSSAHRSYQVSGGYVGELAFSPDGRYLAVSTYALDRSTHEVLILDLSTGTVRHLIDGCHITWSPDSRYVAVHRDPGPEVGAWAVSVVDPNDRWAITTADDAFPLTWTG